ncbi:hypothetical protein [Siphonobacter aquaeclarae]|nr:hypothetical protein [Siphonobacter aquaeclarae]
MIQYRKRSAGFPDYTLLHRLRKRNVTTQGQSIHPEDIRQYTAFSIFI